MSDVINTRSGPIPIKLVKQAFITNDGSSVRKGYNVTLMLFTNHWSSSHGYTSKEIRELYTDKHEAYQRLKYYKEKCYLDEQ
jgi:hypothetical protein